MQPPSPAAGPSPGALVCGKYRLLRRIGEGAMGVVWAAHNEATSREVALKLLVRPDPELRGRLLQEARACGAVRHRNIVDIYDADETESGDPFLVMPLLTGETLASFLKRKRRLESAEAARIARDIARGLAAAHERGIIHRDLKPSNVFLHTEPGESQYVVKLLDFGVSKLLAGAQQMRTATGILVGSPAYMSPEQVQPTGPIDPRADLWALGVVLFEMLTGTRPIQGKAHELLRNVLYGDIPRVTQIIRQIDPGLDDLVSRCLQRDREQRPRSAADVAAALEPFVASSGQPRWGGSSPDLRYGTPQQQGQASRAGAVPAPANMTPLAEARPAAPSAREHVPVGGAWGMAAGAPGAPGSGTAPLPGIAAPGPPAPRERAASKPSHPLLGEFGTLKLSPEQAMAHRAQQQSAPDYRPQQQSAPDYRPQQQPAPAYRPQEQSAPAYRPQEQSAPAYRPQEPSTPAYRPQEQSAPAVAAQPPRHAPQAGPALTPALPAPRAPAPSAPAVVPALVPAQTPSGSAAVMAGTSPTSRSSRVAWIALALLAAMLLLGLGMIVGFLVMRAGVDSLEGRGGEQAALA